MVKNADHRAAEISFPNPPGEGGPGSFQERFEGFLRTSGWKVSYAGSPGKPDIILVVGGTRRLGWLWRMKKKGIPIVLRLDGMGWLHRRRWTGIGAFLKAEVQNLLRKVVHAFLADHVVYQSRFAKEWWERAGMRTADHYSIIYNGVDTDVFKPMGRGTAPVRVVCVEGTLDYSPYAIRLLNELRSRLPVDMPLELFGRFRCDRSEKRLNAGIDYKGHIPRHKVPEALHQAILLSLDIHPACPNGVIEAMACGTPVVAFDTGSMKELVSPEAGLLVDYGSDPWKLGDPDVEALALALQKVKAGYSEYAGHARNAAIGSFGLERMATAYVRILEKLMSQFHA